MSSCRWYEEDKCDEYETDVVVYEEFNTDLLDYTPEEEKPSKIYCPVCENQQATFIWYKVLYDVCGKFDSMFAMYESKLNWSSFDLIKV